MTHGPPATNRTTKINLKNNRIREFYLKMKKQLFIISALVMIFNTINSQSNEEIARSEIIRAEEAYNEGNYEAVIKHLNRSEFFVGPDYFSSYLRVKACVSLGQYHLANEALKTFFDVTPESRSYDTRYQEILALLPEIRDNAEKMSAMEKQMRKKAHNSGEPADYVAFFEKFPLSAEAERKEEILDSLEDSYYNRIRKIDKSSRYNEYLTIYPNGKYTDEARMRINTIPRLNQISKEIRTKERELDYIGKKASAAGTWALIGLGTGAAYSLIFLRDIDPSTGGIRIALSAIPVTIGAVAGISYVSKKSKMGAIKRDIRGLKEEYQQLSIAPVFYPALKGAGFTLALRF